MHMIIVSRAPVQISLGGDGTDLPPYYEQHGGLAISASINYYIYTILSPAQDALVQILSADYRPLTPDPNGKDLIWDRALSLPKAITSHFNVRKGVTVFLASQIPPSAGLGFPGSLTVSMVKALAFRCGLNLNPAEAAELACHIKIEKMGLPVGKQEAYAAAFGGLNAITFASKRVSVRPLNLLPSVRQSLQRRLMLFFTATSCASYKALRRQTEAIRQKDAAVIERLHAIKALSKDIRVALKQGKLDQFGQLLHQSWLNQQELSRDAASAFIEHSYTTALKLGAIGGKITGTNGGGTLVLYCPENQQAAVTKALEGLGLQRIDFDFDAEGAQVLQAIPWENTVDPLGGAVVSHIKRVWASA